MTGCAAGLISGVSSENAHCRGVLPAKTAILRAVLADLVISGKISGKESILAFKAEKENKPVCFGCYSGWEACRPMRTGEWPEECKICKKLNQIRRSI
jgi:hypothetical protein